MIAEISKGEYSSSQSVYFFWCVLIFCLGVGWGVWCSVCCVCLFVFFFGGGFCC